MDLFLGSLDALVLGTTAILLLASVALGTTHVVVRRLAPLPVPRLAAPRPVAAPRTPPVGGVTDTTAHPRRPRAPGIA